VAKSAYKRLKIDINYGAFGQNTRNSKKLRMRHTFHVLTSLGCIELGHEYINRHKSGTHYAI